MSSEFLLLTLLDKEFVIYYKLLTFALRMGVVLTGLKRGFIFSEKPLFPNFIRHNLDKRNSSKMATEREIAKLGSPKTLSIIRERYCVRRQAKEDDSLLPHNLTL